MFFGGDFMNSKFQPGKVAFIVESKLFIRKVIIKSSYGTMYTVIYEDGSGGLRVREKRLFSTLKEAEEYVRREQQIRAVYPA